MGKSAVAILLILSSLLPAPAFANVLGCAGRVLVSGKARTYVLPNKEQKDRWSINDVALSNDGAQLFLSEHKWEYPPMARKMSRTHSRITLLDTKSGTRKTLSLPLQSNNEF